MSPFLVALAFLPPVSPVFAFTNRSRTAITVVPWVEKKRLVAYDMKSGSNWKVEPFKSLSSDQSYGFELKRKSGSLMAKLKFRGLNLTPSRREIRIELGPSAALIRAGSRRLRVIYLPDKPSFKK